MKNGKTIQNFIKSSVGEKLLVVDKIKKRDEALDFVYDLTVTYHQLLHSTSKNHKGLAQNLKTTQKTSVALNQNGNVSLQLSNLVINLMR